MDAKGEAIACANAPWQGGFSTLKNRKKKSCDGQCNEWQEVSAIVSLKVICLPSGPVSVMPEIVAF